MDNFWKSVLNVLDFNEKFKGVINLENLCDIVDGEIEKFVDNTWNLEVETCNDNLGYVVEEFNKENGTDYTGIKLIDNVYADLEEGEGYFGYYEQTIEVYDEEMKEVLFRLCNLFGEEDDDCWSSWIITVIRSRDKLENIYVIGKEGNYIFYTDEDERVLD